MKKAYYRIRNLIMSLFTLLVLSNVNAVFRVSSIYVDDAETLERRGTVVGDVFESIPNIEKVREIKFSSIKNDRILEILLEINRRPFNNLRVVNFQNNNRIEPGVFSDNPATTEALVVLLKNPLIEQVKLFGTVIADKNEGKEDRMALLRAIDGSLPIKDKITNLDALFGKVTTIAWGG